MFNLDPSHLVVGSVRQWGESCWPRSRCRLSEGHVVAGQSCWVCVQDISKHLLSPLPESSSWRSFFSLVSHSAVGRIAMVFEDAEQKLLLEGSEELWDTARRTRREMTIFSSILKLKMTLQIESLMMAAKSTETSQWLWISLRAPQGSPTISRRSGGGETVVGHLKSRKLLPVLPLTRKWHGVWGDNARPRLPPDWPS